MYVVELPVGPGGADVVKVEIREVDQGIHQVSRPGQVVARASRSLGDMLRSVRPVAETFVGTFRDIAQAPDEITLGFGITLTAEADAMITSTSAEANFAVSLVWHRTLSAAPAAQG
ncbi:CU044_2847 family protein [Streptomyces eurythermus]|uniref:CU044_2847 family protein n=1 Tax=Streptomyces eurythermus TaxID=42237 RepID=UPI0033F577E5